MRFSQRLSALPPYLFAEIDRLKLKARSEGVRVIDFGIGDPDLPTPSPIIDRCVEALHDPMNHRYPSYAGLAEFRDSVVRWYDRRGVHGLDAASEVIPLLGSKEGIAHLPLSCIDPGDVVLIPDPGYPVYHSSTLFAGGESWFMPLLSARGFMPDLTAIPAAVVAKAKLMFLNYPNNPTSAMATGEFFEEAVAFCRRHDIILCHDASYLDIVFDGVQAPSLLEFDGAKDIGIEMISLSKSFNMTGWRIAAAAGNRDVIAGLLKIKMNIDSGIFNALQFAGITALDSPVSLNADTMTAYRVRRELLVDCLRELDWPYHQSSGTFYLWVQCPKGQNSMEFAAELLKDCGIVATPGTGFGADGEGYIRFSLTLPTEHVRDAVERLRQRYR